MDADRAAEQAVEEQAGTLAQELSRLKRRGSLLLLAGPAQHGAIATACQRLLGDQPVTRRRLFVVAGDIAGEHHGAESLRGSERRDARAITYETETRSARAAAPTALASPGIEAGVPNRAVDGGLGDLLRALVDEVEAFEERDDGLEPAQLRICVDSVDAMLAGHTERAVFRFLHLLAGVTRRYGAMCHVHLPVDVDSHAVALLQPTCDAVVEVRAADTHQQRWHVPDADLTTDWLLL